MGAKFQSCDYRPPFYLSLYVMRVDLPNASAARNKYSCHRFTAPPTYTQGTDAG